MGLDINKIANQMHCTQKEALQRLKDDALLRAQYKVTEQQLNEFEQLNGGVNWGKTMDEFAYDPSKASEYRANADESKKQRDIEAARRRVAKRNERREQREKNGGLGFTDDDGKFNLAQSAKTVGKVLLAFTPFGMMSCSEDDDINVNTNQTVTINIPREKQIDYTNIINDILSRLNNIDENSKNLSAILNKLEQMITSNSTAEKNYTQMFNEIKDYLQTIVDNQIAMQIDNNKNSADILAQLATIIGSNKTTQQKLDEIIKLLGEIKGVGEQIQNTLEGIAKQLAQSLDNDTTIIAALQKLDANDQETNKLLNTINETLNKLGTKFKGYFKTIICELASGNRKLDQVNRMLVIINRNVNKLNQLVTKYGDKGEELGNAILKAIESLELTVDVDLSGIEEILNKIANNQQLTNDQITNLTESFNSFSANTTNQLNIIISKLDKSSPDYTKQLDAILKMIEKLDKNNDARNQKILCAIEKLGCNLYAGISAILAKLDKSSPNYTQQLDAILKMLEKMENNDETRNKKILAAIEKLGVNIATGFSAILAKLDKSSPDYTKQLDAILNMIEKLDSNNETRNKQILEAISKLGTNLYEKLSVIIGKLDKTSPDYTKQLEAILNMLKTMEGNNEARNQKILAAIEKLGINVASGFSAILAKLDKSSPDYSKQLDAILKMIEKLDANNETRNQKVLNAISKLGTNLFEQISVIIGKLDKSSPDYNAKFDAIIALLEKLDANNDVRNKKVIDAIEKLGIDISVDMTKILNKIGKGGGTSIDYSDILNAILAKLGDMQKDNNNNFSAVLNAIANININPTDLSWIKGHLDAILEAIKNHDVIVKVEGGKCTCCHQDGTPVHEGVLGDLNDLLG